MENTFESLYNESGEEKFSHNDIELISVDFYKAPFSKDSLNMQIQTEIIHESRVLSALLDIDS